MQLLYTPIAGYVHTVEAVINYAELREAVALVPTKPYDSDSPLGDINPLGKVPTLVLGNGDYLAGGPVIYEYLDSLHGKPLLHPQDASRWSALRRSWLADGLFDTLVLLIVESWIAPDEQRGDYVARCWQRVLRILDQQQRDVPATQTLDIGVVRCIGALSFLDKKFGGVSSALPSLEASSFNWQASYPSLAEWYAETSQDAIFNEPLQG